MTITPVLLCGGSGTRLWPLSRRSFPKQFTPLLGAQSLFQASATRTKGADFAAPIIVTGDDFRFIVSKQLAEAEIDAGAMLIEPSARNTAPAVLAAALYLAQSDPDALMLVSPSDHVIPDDVAFRETVARGVPEAEKGRLVTFGIAPTHPETGYGWLELSAPPGNGPVPLTRFVEKPEAAQAQDMLAAGNFLWNAGIFLFTAARFIAAVERHAPDLMAPVQTALQHAQLDLGFVRLEPEAWATVRETSVDYAVMEKARDLSVVPFASDWSDLGGWDAVATQMGPDENGVSCGGPVTALDCENTLLRSESDDLELVGLGLRDLVVVAMPDAVLVADRGRAQEVKKAVAALKQKGVSQAEQFPVDHRPWGWFETLVLSDRFQVKRLVVHPGAALSLQSHVHRSEHWIVVSGTATVTVDDTVKLVTENESIYVPLGAKHRLENPGKVPMVLIEVQTGAYLGEDDIIRYEDIYARN